MLDKKDKFTITWDVIKSDSYTEEHKAIAQETANKLNTRCVNVRKLLLGDVETRLRQWFGSDDIHLVCGCWLFTSEYTEVSTFKDNICESKIYRKLDLSQIRPYFVSDSISSDAFASALEDLRYQFVRLLPVELPLSENEHEELKRGFDRNFLHISNF